MDFSLYLAKFVQIIKQRKLSREERTFEDYLATFADLPPLLKESGKCAIKAELMRMEGNREFQKGDYRVAAILYTTSIKDAPPYSKCAALAYANRSAALFRLKAYEECVLDIDRALDLPYPDDSRMKLISRKEAALPNIKIGKNEKKNPGPNDEMKFPHGENPKLPEASRGIDIVYSSEERRKLVANMPFSTGDLLVIARPYTMVLEKYKDPEYCHHCLKETLCLIPCDNCNVDVYCSEKCRVEAYAKYHRIECRIQATLMSAVTVSAQRMLELIRCLNILTEQGTNLHAVLQEVKELEQSSNPERLRFAEEQFVGNTRRGFLSPLLYGETLQVAEYPGSYFEETYIAILLRNYTDFFKTNADILAVAKLLVSLMTPFELSYVMMPYSGDVMSKAHGTYPLLGVAGHACFNNTVAYHDNNGTFVLRASQKIRPGDQIFFNNIGLQMNFLEKTVGSERFRGANRTCTKCEKTFVYPFEKYSPIKMDKKLCAKLRKNPYNIMALWKLLNIAHESHEPNDLPIQVLKMMLVDAYDGRHERVNAEHKFRLLGIYDKIW